VRIIAGQLLRLVGPRCTCKHKRIQSQETTIRINENTRLTAARREKTTQNDRNLTKKTTAKHAQATVRRKSLKIRRPRSASVTPTVLKVTIATLKLRINSILIKLKVNCAIAVKSRMLTKFYCKQRRTHSAFFSMPYLQP